MSRNARRRPSKTLRNSLLLILLAFAAWLVAEHGDKLPLPEGTTHAARTIAARMAPNMFPPSASMAASEADFRCQVEKITDGDTLRCADGTRVRLHAISAREKDNSCSPGHPCATATADEATATLRALVWGQTLDCMTTGQSYNRVTAICWTPRKVEVNCHMVQTGAAVIWERYDRENNICRHQRRTNGSLR